MQVEAAEEEERVAAEQRAKEQEQAARHDVELAAAAAKAEHEAQLAAVKVRRLEFCPVTHAQRSCATPRAAVVPASWPWQAFP